MFHFVFVIFYKNVFFDNFFLSIVGDENAERQEISGNQNVETITESQYLKNIMSDLKERISATVIVLRIVPIKYFIVEVFLTKLNCQGSYKKLHY